MKKLDKTDIIDMQSELSKSIPGVREKISAAPIPAENQEELLQKILKEQPEVLKSLVDDKTLHKSSSMASQEAIDLATKLRDVNAKLNERAIIREQIRARQKEIEKAAKAVNPRIRAAGLFGVLAGLGSALSSGDVSAAIPVLSEAESLEPSPEDAIIENPQTNPELRKAALQKLMGR